MKKISFMIVLIWVAILLESCSCKTIITLEPDVNDVSSVTEEQLNISKEILEAKLEFMSIYDCVVSVDSEDKRIVIESEKSIPDDIIEELALQQTQLTLRNPDGEILMDGSMIENVDIGVGADGNFTVNIDFNVEGTSEFAAITKKYLDQKISVYLDDTLLIAPTVQAPIFDGRVMIYDDDNDPDMIADTAQRIRESALPFSLRIINIKK